MVIKKKTALKRATAIALSITMLTSALSFATSAVEFDEDDAETEIEVADNEDICSDEEDETDNEEAPEYDEKPISDETNSDDVLVIDLDIEEDGDSESGITVMSYAIKEGMLYITTGHKTGSYTQHWIEPWPDGMEPANILYELIETKGENEIHYELKGINGVSIRWTEAIPDEPIIHTGDEESEEDEKKLSEARIENAKNGKIDKELGYELLDALYEEQNAYKKAYDFYKGITDALKEKVKNANVIKNKLAIAMAPIQKSELTAYITNANKETAYFSKRASMYNVALKSTEYEIKRLTTALGKISDGEESKKYAVPVYEGETPVIDYNTTRKTDDAYWGYWTGYQFKHAIGADDKTVTYDNTPEEEPELTDNMKLLMELCNKSGKACEQKDAEGNTFYLMYEKGKVYKVDEKRKKLGEYTALDVTDVTKQFVSLYKTSSSNAILNSIREEELAFNDAVSFYEKKTTELREIGTLLKKYQKSNAKSMTKKEKDTLNAYIKAYNVSMNYYKKRKTTMSSLLKTATAEAKRLSKVLNAEGDSNGATGGYSFWRASLMSGELSTVLERGNETAKASSKVTGENDIGSAIKAYPLYEGLLNITTGNLTGAWTQHWVTAWENAIDESVEFYTLKQTDAAGNIEYTLISPNGEIEMTWVE